MREHTHRHLPDGSLLRLDLEQGHYVASYYYPDRSVREEQHGSLEAMQNVIDVWWLAALATLGGDAA
jgi:hypothetical protein